jgi:CheY-like chemotaxis protein
MIVVAKIMISDEFLPCVIVPDPNMPKMDGKQAFIALKWDKRFSNVPIVILSTS